MLLDLVGVNWPTVDEDACRDMADALREFADDGRLANNHAQRLPSSGHGEALDALNAHWGKVKVQHLKDMVSAARTIADAYGLLALTEGLRPVRLWGREWRWPLRTEPPDLAAGVRAALVAVYVLHTHGLFDARVVHLRATTLRGIGVTVLDRAFPLRPGSPEDNALPLAEAMDEELSAHGQTPASWELLLSPPVPELTALPPGSLDCAVTLRGTNGFALTLAAGPGASIGRPAAALGAAVTAFDAWAAGL